MSEALKSEITRLSNLKQNRGKDRAWIEKQAQIVLWQKQINLESRFSDKENVILMEKLFDSYLENYEISSLNDMQNLADLIYEEVMQQKIQKDIDKILSDVNTKFIPDKQIESLHAIQERIWKLKEKIGIVNSTKKDDLTALQELEKKFEIYNNFNRHEFTCSCAYCGELLLLRRRVKDFNALKHPAFSGRFLYNVEVIDDVKKGLITKEQAAKYLRTSSQYIDWVIKNEHKIINIQGVSEEVVDEFVNNTPYLRNANEYKDLGEENEKK